MRDAHDTDIVQEGRPDLHGDFNWGVTQAKRFPPYVHSASRNSSLVHKVARVELRWWRPDYHRLVRLSRPRVHVHTVCGQLKFLDTVWNKRRQPARMCMVPAPAAVLCGRCHGGAASFGKDGAATKAGIARQEGYARLGCTVAAYNGGLPTGSALLKEGADG